jgi:hypothetical protein
MNVKAFKKKVKTKFGSLSNFARASNRKRMDLQILLAKKQIPREDEEKLESDFARYDGDPVGNVISEEQLKQLNKKINDAGGVYQFCKNNPDFSQRQVYEVVGGNRMRLSKLVKKLLTHFQIEFEELETD